MVDADTYLADRGHDSMSPRAAPTRQPCVRRRTRGNDHCVNNGRDAGGEQSPTKQQTRTGDERDERDADRATRDPDSPGATIDSPTPAEPNEPG